MRPAAISLLVLALGGCGEHVPDELETAIDAHWADVGARGVTVTVRTGGNARSFARGVSSVAEGREMAPDDRLRVGSITKTFVATVILQLADEGALSLDDAIDRWVPGFALGPEVTIRRALAHMTGVFNYTDDASFLNRVAAPTTPTDTVRFALQHPAVFAPGASYGYSNTNFVLLGMVIEAVTHQDYPSVVRTRLLDPLGLADTFVEGSTAAPGLVPGYILGAVAPPYDPSWGFGAGSMVSTGEDLCGWADALYRGQVLPAPMLALMTRESQPPDGKNSNYGLGAQLYRRGGRDVVGHTGSTMGFNAELFIELVSGDCVAVLSNDFFGETEAVAEPIWQMLPI